MSKVLAIAKQTADKQTEKKQYNVDAIQQKTDSKQTADKKQTDSKQKTADKQKQTSKKTADSKQKQTADSKKTDKKQLTSAEDVRIALHEAKLDSLFRVVATPSSVHDNNVKIHVVNNDNTLSATACFCIGINRLDFRFSSNDKFSACKFLAKQTVNSKKRFEVTVKREDIVKVLKEACTDYAKRNKLTLATATEKTAEATAEAK